MQSKRIRGKIRSPTKKFLKELKVNLTQKEIERDIKVLSAEIDSLGKNRKDISKKNVSLEKV